MSESKKRRRRRNRKKSSSSDESISSDLIIFVNEDEQQQCDERKINIPAGNNSSEASNHGRISSTKVLPIQPNHSIISKTTIESIHPTDTTNMNDISASSPKTNQEEIVIDQLCKIILTIHTRQEFVSMQRVEHELFKHFGVRSYRKLNVEQRNLTPLVNLSQRHKTVILYMQVFERVVNLCTLHDLGPMIAKFLKLDTYDDAHLGPLVEHPHIKRIFQYKRPTSGNAITEITTANVISEFIDFQAKYYGPQRIPFDEFLEELVKKYKVESREQLGVFCRSFPYLTEVTRKLTNEYRRYTHQTEVSARSEIMKIAREKFSESIKGFKNELQILSDTKNASPLIIFDRLISIVEKYLIVSEQPIIVDTLNKFRKDELLQCLFNVSFCLGTMKNPEELMNELKKFYHYPIVNTIQAAPNSTQSVQSAYHKQLQPIPVFNQSSQLQNNMMRTTVDTSFENKLLSSKSSTSVNKPRINPKQLCMSLSQYLQRYDSILTIKQWTDIEKDICMQHGVSNFFELGVINEDEGGHHPLSLVSYLHVNRQRIDPYGELSIYENGIPMSNRRDLYTFVNQLLRGHDKQEDHAVAASSTKRPVCFSADQLSAVEKGIKHKFGSLLGFQNPTQIINKAKQQQQTSSMIYFEESLLDVVSLNHLNISPLTLCTDETQLCRLILQCPIMTDLYTWLQWLYFFQPKYGLLKAFINRKKTELDGLLLLETSTHELFRLPTESSLTHFEQELAKMNVRSAVGYLCTSIILEYVHVNRLPFSIYRQVMHTWFILLQSSATFGHKSIDPMQYILEFLTHLPALIGQTLIVQELVLEPLDDVFHLDEKEKKMINNREKLWLLANDKQKSKLEMWGYLLDIKEWKNTDKWIGQKQRQIESIGKQTVKIANTNISDVTIKDNIQSIVVGQTKESNVPSSTLENYANDNNTKEKRIISNNNSIQAAYEHIESIRRGFGVNAGLDSNGQSIVNNLQGMIERSLEKLSNDLYSEQGHFVLELIQNADDNQYLSDRLPTLRFIHSSERILVCNNEFGFQPMHISAICNVGASTKGKHKQGYAGHKGIGFKSVFMVSDCPEIYSGSYQFCFDTVNGTQQIGYIRPIWLDKPFEPLPLNNIWVTCIRLPIKKEKRGDRLQRNFDDIQPILLLFLNRLRRIEIVREHENQTVSNSSFTRIDHAQGQIIELQERTTQTENIVKHFWLVVKKVIHVPTDLKMKLSEVKCDVESTTIAIAYPLNPIYECSSRQVLPTQPLFAYLPLRSYGFRFILQADFEITSARQEVIRDNRWNDWLKSEIVQLFPLAYERFQHVPDLLAQSTLDFQQNTNPLTKIQTLKYFLKLVPMRNEIDPYFNTFVDKSIQGLMGIIRLPVFTHDDEKTIDWVLPSQCVLVRDLFIRKIFSQNLLLSHFNSYYLHDEFLKDCDEQILIKLGCRRLDFADILKLIRTLYKQNDQIHSTKTTSIEQIAQWLLCIDYSLQQEREKPGFNNDGDDDTEITTMAELKQLKIIPLRQQSRLVSLDEFENRAILFPPDKSIKFAKHLNIVFDDLPTIDDRLLDYIEDKYPRRLDSIKLFLINLGLCDSRNIRRVYSNHILPVIRDDSQWSKKSDSTLIAYLICIYKELFALNPETFEYEMKQLKKTMLIKTTNGKFIRLDSDKTIIHLTSFYGCTLSLEHLKLPNHQFTFISNDYIQEYHKELFYQDYEKRRFLAFLKELGIYDSFKIDCIERGFIDTNQLINTPWENERSSLSELLHEPFTIYDWSSDEFNALISSEEKDINQCTQLLIYLHQYHQQLSKYYVGSVIISRMRHSNMPPSPVKGVETSFLRSLRQYAWIPVVGDKLFKPSDVYCLHPNDSFRRYVPHLDVLKIPLKNSDFIFNILGMKKEITSVTMFELFMQWSCNMDRNSLYEIINCYSHQTNNEPIPCILPRIKRQSCLDKIENITKVYQMIIADGQTSQAFTRFRLWPIIFVPRTGDMGDFLYVDEVIWNDPHALLVTTNSTITNRNLTTQHTLIHPYYGQNTILSSYFINQLQIKQHPTLEDYLPLLSNVANKKKDYIWRCIDLITSLAFAQNRQTLVLEKCANWAFIPCFGPGNKYHKYSDPIFYPHDIEIASLFIDQLLIINPSDRICTPGLKNTFCSMFKIPNLSNIIKIHADGDNEQPSIELTKFYGCIIDLIQSFLIKHDNLSETRSNYFQSVFSRMKIISVDRIRFSYSYNDGIIRTLKTSKTQSFYIDESNGKFFILKIIEKPDKEVQTLANYLVENDSIRRKLTDFIKNLYKIYQQKGEDGLTQSRKTYPSQPESLKWFIPPVVKITTSLLLETEVEDDDEQITDLNNVSINISDEAIDKIKKESNIFPPKTQSKKVKVEGESKPLTCFPIKPRTTDLHPPSTDISQEKKVQSDSMSTTPKSDSTSISKDQTQRMNPDALHSKPKKITDAPVTKTNNAAKANADDSSHGNPNSRSMDRNSANRNVPSNIFECIRVSNIQDFNISASNILASENNPSSSSVEIDIKTGRNGEDFVFRYLQWKYPNEEIVWVNQKTESGLPFDIRLVYKTKQRQTELIEVKTTRSNIQNTFQMSIGEIECLLANPDSYSIYRVYHNNDEKLSTITILSQLKVHLQKKHLAISMTIMAKPEK